MKLMKGFVPAMAFVWLAALLAVSSCGKDDDKDVKKVKDPVAVTGIEVVSPAGLQVTLEKGTTFQIEAHVLPENATDQEIVYSSNRPDIATVDGKGLVTAVDGPLHGQVSILVKSRDGNFGKYVRVDVPKEVVHATSIGFARPSYEIEQNQPTLLYVTAKPSNAVYPGIVFSSSDPSIVEVTQQGGYMACVEGKRGGTATIIATTLDGNLTATTQVKVNDAYVTGVSMEVSSLTLDVGGSHQLKVSVKRSNGTTDTSNKGVVFSSQDPAVATVSESGLVKGVAYGSTRVSASIGGMTASLICKVNPEAPKSSTEAIRMLRECQWKMDVEPGDYKDVFYDEVRYEFTEDAHFCRIFHVRSDLSSKHEYYKWRGEYVGYEHKVHCQITPESSDPTKGKIVVDEIFVGNGSFVAPVHIRFSKLNQAGWYMVRGEWKNTDDGAEIVWPDTGVNMVRTKDRVSFIVLGYEEVE